MPTETRYFRSDYVLGTTNTAVGASVSLTATGFQTGHIGIRVFKVVGTTETELTTDIIDFPVTGTEYVSGEWDAPDNVAFDKIRVKVYLKLGTGAWTLKATFDTETINGVLKAATWTFWLYGDWQYDTARNRSTVWFYFGASVYNSRIENFTWTPYVPPPAGVPRFIGDGLAGAAIIALMRSSPKVLRWPFKGLK
jgi:hypothetical protein